MTGIVLTINQHTSQLYKACLAPNCGKRLTEIGQEHSDIVFLYCPKCEHDTETFSWQIMLSVLLTDATGSTWINLFTDTAEKLLDRKVAELVYLHENDLEGYMALLRQIQFKRFRMRVSVKMENSEGEQRLKVNLIKPYPVNDHVDRAKRLMTCIDALSAHLK